MNWIEFFQSEPWPSLVKALLHSLWQGALIATILYVLLRRLSAARTNLRYVLCLGAMAVVFLATSATWRIATVQVDPIRIAAGAQQDSTLAEADVSIISIEPDAVSVRPVMSLPKRTPWMAWGAAVWVAGAILMCVRVGISALGAWRLRASCQPLEISAIRTLAEQARTAMKIGRRVALAVSDRLQCPVVIGALWPVLLLPASMITQLSPDQLRAIFAHEMAHIRRHDYLLNLLQMFVEALFFFNPAIWWISRQVRIEREACCDAAAVAAGFTRADYAHALLAAGGHGGNVSPALAFGSGTRQTLLDRFRRILTPSSMPQLRLPWYSLAAMLFLSAVLLGGLCCGAREVAEFTAEALAPEPIECNAAVGPEGHVWYFYTPQAGEFQFAFCWAEGNASIWTREEDVYDDFLLLRNYKGKHSVDFEREEGILAIDGKKYDLKNGRVFNLKGEGAEFAIEQKSVALPIDEVRAEEASLVLYQITKQCLRPPSLEKPEPGSLAERSMETWEDVGILEDGVATDVMPKDVDLTLVVNAEDGQEIPAEIEVSFKVKTPGGSMSISGDEIGKSGVFTKKLHAGNISCVVSAPGYAPALMGPFRMVSGEERKVDVTLQRGFEGVIKIISSDGTPVSGAQLRGSFVHEEKTINFSGNIVLNLQTNDGGLIKIPNAVEKPFLADFTAPGFQYDRVVINPTPEAISTLVVKTARPATGIVVSGKDGKPIPSAQVVVVDIKTLEGQLPDVLIGHRGELQCLTDRQGHFSLDRLRDDMKYVLSVSADGFGPVLIGPVQAGQENIRAALGSELYIKGRIIGDISSLRRGPRGPFIWVSQTLRLGTSHLPASNSDTVYVTVKDGVAYFEIRRFKPSFTGWPGQLYQGIVEISVAKRTYRVNLDQSIDDFVIDLDKPQWPMRPFVLKLLTPEGAPKPIGSVDITVWQPDNSLDGRKVLIQDGEVRLDVPVPCRLNWYSREIPGYWLSSESSEDMRVIAGPDPFVVETTLFPAGLVHGTFLDSDGKPAPIGAHISLLVVNAPPGCASNKITGNVSLRRSNDSINFASSPLPLGGTYRLFGTEGMGGGPRVTVSPQFTVTEDDPIREVNLQFPREFITARVMVFTPNGKPAAGVNVHTSCFRYGGKIFITDENGEAVLKDLNPEAEYGVRVGGYQENVDFISQSLPLNLNSEPTIIHLKEGKTIKGLVLDDVTGDPVKDVQVSGNAIPPDKGYARAFLKTNEKGEFVIRGVADGRYLLQAGTWNLESREKLTGGECEVTAGQNEPVVIRLKPVK